MSVQTIITLVILCAAARALLRRSPADPMAGRLVARGPIHRAVDYGPDARAWFDEQGRLERILERQATRESGGAI